MFTREERDATRKLLQKLKELREENRIYHPSNEPGNHVLTEIASCIAQLLITRLSGLQSTCIHCIERDVDQTIITALIETAEEVLAIFDDAPTANTASEVPKLSPNDLESAQEYYDILRKKELAGKIIIRPDKGYSEMASRFVTKLAQTTAFPGNYYDPENYAAVMLWATRVFVKSVSV